MSDTREKVREEELTVPGVIKEMHGKQVGNWSVMEMVDRPNTTATDWLCRCKCGALRVVGGGKLRQEKSLSCGCIKVIDITGKIFGTWKVKAGVRGPDGQYVWLCKDIKSYYYALFTKSELTRKVTAPSFSEMVEFDSDNYDSNPGDFGTWKLIGKTGDLIGTDGKEFYLVNNLVNHSVCQCAVTGFLAVFPNDLLSKETPPPSPLDERKRPRRAQDLTGNKFNTLVAKRLLPNTNDNNLAVWECQCESCGDVKEIDSFWLKRGAACKKCGKPE